MSRWRRTTSRAASNALDREVVERHLVTDILTTHADDLTHGIVSPFYLDPKELGPTVGYGRQTSEKTGGRHVYGTTM